MPAIHGKSLLAFVECIRFDHLRQTGIGGRKDTVLALRMFEIPGTPEIVLGSGTANGRPLRVPVQIEFNFSFATLGA
jgi:hypothetical protein